MRLHPIQAAVGSSWLQLSVDLKGVAPSRLTMLLGMVLYL